jgi:hypothetical protein
MIINLAMKTRDDMPSAVHRPWQLQKPRSRQHDATGRTLRGELRRRFGKQHPDGLGLGRPNRCPQHRRTRALGLFGASLRTRRQSNDGMRLRKMNDNSGLIGAPFPHTAERGWGGGEYRLVARPIRGRTLTGLLRAALDPAQEPNARRRCASQTV